MLSRWMVTKKPASDRASVAKDGGACEPPAPPVDMAARVAQARATAAATPIASDGVDAFGAPSSGLEVRMAQAPQPASPATPGQGTGDQTPTSPPESPVSCASTASDFSTGSDTSGYVVFDDEPATAAPVAHLDAALAHGLLARLTLADLGAGDRLDAVQSSAVCGAAKLASGLSDKARPAVQRRFAKLGYDQQQFEQVETWLRDRAPIQIYFSPEKECGGGTVIDAFLTDTHYRNQFETGISGGALCNSSRIYWEDDLFGRQYARTATGESRPKYGVINVFGTPVDQAATSYGGCFFQLKNVRLRTTFTPRDSAGLKSNSVATCEHMMHFLEGFKNHELAELGRVARQETQGNPAFGKAYFLGAFYYREAQIHGPIEFARDIEVLYVPRSASHLAEKFETFAQMNGFPWRYY